MTFAALLVAYWWIAHGGGFVVPSGRERAILTLLQPLRVGGTVVDGWTLENVEVEHDVIRLEMQKPGLAGVTIDLFPRSWLGGLVSTGGVALRAGRGTPLPLLDAVREAIDHKSIDSVWMREAAEDAGAATGLRLARAIDRRIDLRVLLLAAMLALIACTAALVVQRFEAPAVSPAATVAILAITAVGSVLRFTLSPPTFLHEYYHTAESLPALLDGGGAYGLAGPALYWKVNQLFGGGERAVFATNAVLASATVPAVVFLDLALRRSVATALTSGALVALLPAHLRFSASEELWIPGILFAVWSLAAWAAWLRRPDHLALAVAVIALALGMQSRPELLALPAAHLLLALLLRPPRAWLRTFFGPATLAALVGLALLFARRAVELWNVQGAVPALHPPDLLSIALADTTFTPPPLLVLAAIGGLSGMARRSRETLWLVSMTALFTLVPAYAFGNAPCRWRTQILGAVFASMLAGGVPLAVDSSAIRRRATPIVCLVIVACAALGLWQRRERVTELLDAQLEWAFLRDTVPGLPVRGELIAYFGWSEPADGLDWIDPFPAFLLDRNEKRLEPIELRRIGGGRGWPEPRPGLLYYQGMDCWGAMRPTRFFPMRDRCMEVAAHYELRPLHVATLETLGYSHLNYAPGPYSIGFFEVTGLR